MKATEQYFPVVLFYNAVQGGSQGLGLRIDFLKCDEL